MLRRYNSRCSLCGTKGKTYENETLDRMCPSCLDKWGKGEIPFDAPNKVKPKQVVAQQAQQPSRQVQIEQPSRKRTDVSYLRIVR